MILRFEHLDTKVLSAKYPKIYIYILTYYRATLFNSYKIIHSQMDLICTNHLNNYNLSVFCDFITLGWWYTKKFK